MEATMTQDRAAEIMRRLTAMAIRVGIIDADLLMQAIALITAAREEGESGGMAVARALRGAIDYLESIEKSGLLDSELLGRHSLLRIPEMTARYREALATKEKEEKKDVDS